MKKCLMMMIVAFACVGCATQQQRAERLLATKMAVEQMLEKKEWHVDIVMMSSMRYGSHTVTPDFFLEMRGDTLRSYMPYLGQSYQAPMYSQSGGLDFEKRMQNYDETHPKTDLTKMEMDVKTEDDTYHFVIEVFDTGKTYINVRSRHRDPISYDGNMTEIEHETKSNR